MAKYLVVGSNPDTDYAGNTLFTSLNVIGANLTKEQADKLAKDKYDDCGGLLIVINQETGESE